VKKPNNNKYEEIIDDKNANIFRDGLTGNDIIPVIRYRYHEDRTAVDGCSILRLIREFVRWETKEGIGRDPAMFAGNEGEGREEFEDGGRGG